MPAWNNQRVVRVGSEKLVMVGSESSVDDKIVLVAGSDLPVILRANGEHWNYVGPCYHPGAMTGERWPEREAALVEMVLV
jgi:hypothetical protein